MAKQTYSVLLVDDSEHDRLFMRRTIVRNPRLNIVAEMEDGEAAIAYLSGNGKFTDRNSYPFPDVVLLDLKMPKVTGHEVLQWLQTKAFDKLFVAVLSGSILPEDVARSMALGAHAYYKKNALKEEREAMVQEILQSVDRL